MNFDDERYVRVYTRKTVNSKVIGWEGRATLMALLLEVDRAGVLDLDGLDPAEALTALSELPIEITSVGMRRLIDRGTVRIDGGRLVVPRFLEAQEARQSDAQRQRESRAKRAAIANVSEHAVRAAASAGVDVTNRDHIESQNVTECHTVSHAVTDGHSVLSSAEISSADQDTPTECQPSVASPRSAPRNKRPSRAESIPVLMSDSVVISEELIAAKAVQWEVSAERIRAQIPEFRRYWVDEKARKSPRGWLQAFGNRVDSLGKRGMLHDPERAVIHVRSGAPRARTTSVENTERQKERARVFLEEEARNKQLRLVETGS